ncbi:2-deoxyglucose-6-phosphate phosphatase [Operophtera brumata]|uniref:2-deoxyglucose-6-phosphate phosphatase n=1 Tax=Operophtera brumata TaxID=104452 RepID=A0A0L7KR64_OPEBR|nr:2-deoxyglucose-6-phosphate phosphatase [Operophtera brumata]
MAYKPVTHVLFDMDGLILKHLYTIVFQKIVSKFGKEYTWELKMRLMGFQALETANIIVEELELPMTADEFIAESTLHMQTLFPDTEVLPGAKRLIEHLHKHKIPIGLATSSSIESYELKTNKHHRELFSLFPYKTFGTSDPEVKRGKPYPDIFLCLVLEDAVNGVRAARAAGMQVVMVPDPRVDEALAAEATLLLDSLEQFKPELPSLSRLSIYLHLAGRGDTYIDTEDLYSIGFQKVASRYGKEFTFALKCKIMGQQSREFSKMIIDELELPLTVDEFIRETREIFDQLFTDCTVMSGKKVDEFIRETREIFDQLFPDCTVMSGKKVDEFIRETREIFDQLFPDCTVMSGKKVDEFIRETREIFDQLFPECTVMSGKKVDEFIRETREIFDQLFPDCTIET